MTCQMKMKLTFELKWDFERTNGQKCTENRFTKLIIF